MEKENDVRTACAVTPFTQVTGALPGSPRIAGRCRDELGGNVEGARPWVVGVGDLP